jgi:hypothetical protein
MPSCRERLGLHCTAVEAIVTGLVGALIVLMIGWLKLDINRLSDKIDHLDERLSNRIDALDVRLSARLDDLAERVSRIEGRLDERHQTRPT